jgi:hypothetical protein
VLSSRQYEKLARWDGCPAWIPVPQSEVYGVLTNEFRDPVNVLLLMAEENLVVTTRNASYRCRPINHVTVRIAD